MVKVTEKEYELLKNIQQDWQSQESDDGSLSAFVSNDEYDMKITRGLIGSLVKKGIITSELWEKGASHESDAFYVKVNNEYGKNYKLINIEVA